MKFWVFVVEPMPSWATFAACRIDHQLSLSLSFSRSLLTVDSTSCARICSRLLNVFSSFIGEKRVRAHSRRTLRSKTRGSFTFFLCQELLKHASDIKSRKRGNVNERKNETTGWSNLLIYVLPRDARAIVPTRYNLVSQFSLCRREKIAPFSSGSNKFFPIICFPIISIEIVQKIALKNNWQLEESMENFDRW